MTETVTSKYNGLVWVTAGLYILFIFALIYLGASLIGSKNDEPELLAIIAIVLVLGIIYTVKGVSRLIKVTVSPDALIINYQLINHQIRINYADIAHESVVDARIGRRPGTIYIMPDVSKLKIELNTGSIYYLYASYYKNFDELAEAIRRARFKLE